MVVWAVVVVLTVVVDPGETVVPVEADPYKGGPGMT